MINVYDFEVYKYDWLVVIINPLERTKSVIVNDPDKLREYYNRHRSQIFVGYNSREYDSYIFKGIILGFNPKEISDFIIKEEKKGWQFSTLLKDVTLYDYDVMPNPPIGLKTLEGFMGNNIKETDVPFDIDRKLTTSEIQQTIEYCTHDVEQTAEIFLQRKSDFDAQMSLIKMFNLPLTAISKTESRLVADILDCKWKNYGDEWDLSVLPCVKLKKYAHVAQWFLDPKNHDYSSSLTIDIAGVPHTFGWGGLHGAPNKPIHRKGLILHVDVNSYYPSILIYWNLISRSARHPERYREIYFNRLELKRQGKKKEQKPHKLMLNALSGAMKDRYNSAYDPRNNNLMCINGQLMLLDLLEKLEGHCEIIQSNTDGLIIQIEDSDEAFETIDDICYEWEQRTKMGLALDTISEIYQKDVNNYVWIEPDGKVERKGAYIKELNDLDYDLPIINEALLNYMTKHIPVEVTINQCDDLRKFQKIVKLSDKYEKVIHNGKKYDYKCYRVFASKVQTDGSIYKCKTIHGQEKRDKFGNTPERCFIQNDDIKKADVPNYLDRDWYIELSRKRLEQYGL